MASKNSKTSEDVATVVPTVIDEWNEIDFSDALTAYEPRTTFLLEEIGDRYTGVYEGTVEVVNPNTGDVYTYQAFANETVKYQTPNNWSLEKGLKDVPVGSIVRLELMAFVDMGDNKSDHKAIKVLYKAPVQL